MTTLTSCVNRILFVLAFALAAIAVPEKIANLLGYTILRGVYEPGRILEFAAVALLFVIALLLREIRRRLDTKEPT